MSAAPAPRRALLLDLDGTLADTAPDLAAAANALRTARGLQALPLAALRPWASHGARGLVDASLGVAPEDPGYASLRDEFLANYTAAMCVQTRVFAGLMPLLEHCRRSALPWGIVTNKHSRFAQPIVAALGLAQDCAVLVCGDTTEHAKPHPAPLLHAAAVLAVPPENCVYVGDDERDITAGRAAGMCTVAAGWGYCSGVDPHTWGANVTLQHAEELEHLLEQWAYLDN
jgi:phosphoglycolate phosphatase